MLHQHSMMPPPHGRSQKVNPQLLRTGKWEPHGWSLEMLYPTGFPNHNPHTPTQSPMNCQCSGCNLLPHLSPPCHWQGSLRLHPACISACLHQTTLFFFMATIGFPVSYSSLLNRKNILYGFWNKHQCPACISPSNHGLIAPRFAQSQIHHMKETKA